MIGDMEEQLQLLLGVFYVSTWNFLEGNTGPLGKYSCRGVWLGDFVTFQPGWVLLAFLAVRLEKQVTHRPLYNSRER